MTKYYCNKKKKQYCKRMKTALTAGRKVDRQIETDENGNLYIFTVANDQTPYNEKKEKIDFCPFCGKEI